MTGALRLSDTKYIIDPCLFFFLGGGGGGGGGLLRPSGQAGSATRQVARILNMTFICFAL